MKSTFEFNIPAAGLTRLRRAKDISSNRAEKFGNLIERNLNVDQLDGTVMDQLTESFEEKTS